MVTNETDQLNIAVQELTVALQKPEAMKLAIGRVLKDDEAITITAAEPKTLLLGTDVHKLRIESKILENVPFVVIRRVDENNQPGKCVIGLDVWSMNRLYTDISLGKASPLCGIEGLTHPCLHLGVDGDKVIRIVELFPCEEDDTNLGLEIVDLKFEDYDKRTQFAQCLDVVTTWAFQDIENGFTWSDNGEVIPLVISSSVAETGVAVPA